MEYKLLTRPSFRSSRWCLKKISTWASTWSVTCVTFDMWHVVEGEHSLKTSAPKLIQFGKDSILKIGRNRIAEWPRCLYNSPTLSGLLNISYTAWGRGWPKTPLKSICSLRYWSLCGQWSACSAKFWVYSACIVCAVGSAHSNIGRGFIFNTNYIHICFYPIMIFC